MPQQLKQFVENSKKQREYKNYSGERSGTEEIGSFEPDIDFGKHFLTFAGAQPSSEDETRPEGGGVGDSAALNMSLHE